MFQTVVFISAQIHLIEDFAVCRLIHSFIIFEYNN